MFYAEPSRPGRSSAGLLIRADRAGATHSWWTGSPSKARSAAAGWVLDRLPDQGTALTSALP
jgi:hypothetical protein